MGDAAPAALTLARERMNETNLQFELAKKEQEKVAAAVQESSVKKDETNRQIEQPKTGLIKSIVKVSELRLKVEKSERDEKGRAEEAANLARRVQREKDLQKKEARKPMPAATRRLHPKQPHCAHRLFVLGVAACAACPCGI